MLGGKEARLLRVKLLTGLSLDADQGDMSAGPDSDQ